MRKIQLIVAIMIGFACHVCAQDMPKTTADTAAAPPAELPPYKKNPSLPAFNILTMDSTTIFNTFNIPKGRKIAIVMFSPDCSHCKRFTNHLAESMDSLAQIDFYFVTPYSKMDEIRKFYRMHRLAEYSNVKMVGRDLEFFTGRFYELHMVPAIALYDEQKKLLGLLEGEAPVSAIYQLATQ